MTQGQCLLCLMLFNDQVNRMNFALDSLLVLFITSNSPSRCQDDYYWSYNPQNRHCYRVCKKTFKKLLAYSRQAYDTYDQAIGNYYGLSFEMAREFCQVKILNRSPSICTVVVIQLLLPILFFLSNLPGEIWSAWLIAEKQTL